MVEVQRYILLCKYCTQRGARDEILVGGGWFLFVASLIFLKKKKTFIGKSLFSKVKSQKHVNKSQSQKSKSKKNQIRKFQKVKQVDLPRSDCFDIFFACFFLTVVVFRLFVFF